MPGQYKEESRFSQASHKTPWLQQFHWKLLKFSLDTGERIQEIMRKDLREKKNL